MPILRKVESGAVNSKCKREGQFYMDAIYIDIFSAKDKFSTGISENNV